MNPNNPLNLDISPCTVVPNELRPEARIAILGEAPSRQEVEEGRLFVGGSGRLFWAVLGHVGISRYMCSVLNVSQFQPPGNDITAFAWDGPELTEGRQAIAAAIAAQQPNIVFCLGSTALNTALGTGPNTHSIHNWTGSLFWSPVWMCKCLACLHPVSVLRMYTQLLYLRTAARRLAEERHTKELNLPEYALVAEANYDAIISLLDDIAKRRDVVAMDIEGGLGSMSCISFATSSRDAFIVPLTRGDGTSLWTVAQEAQIWRALARVISNPDVPKILQNYLYDSTVLHSYGLPILGLADDTMLKHWELLPEFDKSLAVQASLYTRQPYWKDDRSSSGERLWRYCCLDSAVTYAINTHLTNELYSQPGSFAHYRFNVSLLPAMLYMQLRGMAFDKLQAAQRLHDLAVDINTHQHEVNQSLGFKLPETQADFVKLVATTCCRKNMVIASGDALTASLIANAKKPYAADIYELARIAQRWPDVTASERGFASTKLKLGINVDSPKQMLDLLYNQWKLPVQLKRSKVAGRLRHAPTSDQLAMLNLYGKTQDPRLLAMLRLRGKLDQRTYLCLSTDKDGRVRTALNLVGTETGRINSYESLSGSGTNLTTVPRAYRSLFVADPGHVFFQCDLEGADGWTVAAHCAALGDPTMLDDYRAGLKPAKIIALAYMKGPDVLKLSRPMLKDACLAVGKDGWLYLGAKRVFHGTNYGMQPQTMSDQLLKDSYKLSGEPIYVPPMECAKLQRLVLLRYPGIQAWHRNCRNLLVRTGKLTNAGGHTRHFLNRREEVSTLKEYLADEPQENTTYAIKLALHRLWHDPENRRGDNVLYVEPLLTVHDAICGQWQVERTAFAVRKLHEWFDNTLTIANSKIVIPFDGAYGPSWGELTTKI